MQIFWQKNALCMYFFGVTRPLLDDSRAPNPLETPPKEYILR